MKKVVTTIFFLFFLITLFGCESVHDYETDRFSIHEFNYFFEITGYTDNYFDENLVINYDLVAHEKGSSNEVNLVIDGIAQNAFQNLDLKSISFDFYTRSEYWRISNYAFADNVNLINIEFNGLLFYLDDFVFANDSNIMTIDLGNVRSIGDSAFTNCEKLEEVKMGTGILSIGNNAFENCADNISLYLYNPIPPVIGSDLFKDIENYKIYVLPNSLDAYMNANVWSSFASHIYSL